MVILYGFGELELLCYCIIVLFSQKMISTKYM